MRLNLALLLLCLAGAAAYTFHADYTGKRAGSMQAGGGGGASASGSGQTPSPKTAAPDFSFKDIKGMRRDLHDFGGKAIVLNFWASWCAPCVIEFPQMLDLAKQTRENAVFIFLSIDDSDEAMMRFVQKLGPDAAADTVYIGRDADKTVAQDLFQTYKIPETFLITPDLVIAEKIIGADIAWNDAAMAERLRALAETGNAPPEDKNPQ
ncbi:MAG: TlpA disulfide reductase family protein [Micavibrio sp.]